jgi:hypothetical protein
MGAANCRAERHEVQGWERLVKEAGRTELEGIFSETLLVNTWGVYGLGYLPDFLMPPPCSGPLPLAFSCIALSACTTHAAGLRGELKEADKGDADDMGERGWESGAPPGPPSAWP